MDQNTNHLVESSADKIGVIFRSKAECVRFLNLSEFLNFI